MMIQTMWQKGKSLSDFTQNNIDILTGSMLIKSALVLVDNHPSPLLLCLIEGPHVHKEKSMSNYETISIIRPAAGEEAVAKISERTAEIITAAGGEIMAVDNWGLKKLAYPIKKEETGYFVYTVFKGNGAGVDEMERIFRIDDNVLKYMTIRLDDDFVLPEKKDDDVDEAQDAA